MLVEREVDAKLLLKCIASYLVLSTTSKIGPNMIKIVILLVLVNNSSRHEVIVHCTLFGAEHDERHDPLIQSMIKFGISLPAINNSSRHEVIVHCILFEVEHDEHNDPWVQTVI